MIPLIPLIPLRALRFIGIAAVVAFAACADLKELMALSAAIQEQYHAPATVNIVNGSHLSITFQNLPADAAKTDSAGRQQFAHDVASFAKSHYAQADRLADVTIAFATVTRRGPLTVTRTDAPYSFATKDLP